MIISYLLHYCCHGFPGLYWQGLASTLICNGTEQRFRVPINVIIFALVYLVHQTLLVLLCETHKRIYFLPGET